MNNSVDELVQKFNNLDLHKQQIVLDLVDNLQIEKQDDSSHYKTTPVNRIENNRFRSQNGVSLSIGDRVRILNSRKTGKSGDTAIVVKFNKVYVAVKLEKNNSVTQRASKNLRFIEE